MGIQMIETFWLIKNILIGGILWMNLPFMEWGMMDTDSFYCAWVNNGDLVDRDK